MRSRGQGNLGTLVVKGMVYLNIQAAQNMRYKLQHPNLKSTIMVASWKGMKGNWIQW